MEVMQTSAPETPTSQTPTASEPASQPTQTTSAAESTPNLGSENPKSGSDAAVIPAAPTYQPNFKFSVMKKEHEVPELYRGLIQDPDTEKQVKELFEKAYGLEHVKTERSKVSDELKQYRNQTEPIMKIAQQLEYHRQKGDLTNYFRALGLNKQEVWKWAVQEAEREELPEHQRRAYDQQQEASLRAYHLEQQLQEQQSQFQQFQVQQRTTELQSVLSKPDVSSFVQAFDQRNGEGSFRGEVIARGQMYWHTQGVDMPPERVVQEIMTRYGQSQAAPAMQPAAPQAKAPAQVPVIPNTGTGNSSPAQRSIRTLDDLKKIAAEKFA